jgi:hypothetical protein
VSSPIKIKNPFNESDNQNIPNIPNITNKLLNDFTEVKILLF